MIQQPKAIAVTDHAVQRYRERVPSADKLTDESIRELIRGKVNDAFNPKNQRMWLRAHPTVPERRIVPFKVGEQWLYLSLAPNRTSFQADVAVIGVLFAKELGGQNHLSIPLGEAAPELEDIKPQIQSAKYIVRIGSGPTIESYDFQSDEELDRFLQRRKPNPEEGIFIYERRDLKVEVRYVIQKPQ